MTSTVPYGSMLKSSRKGVSKCIVQSRTTNDLANLLRFGRLVLAVPVTLDLLEHGIDGLGLLVPFTLAHLELLLEELIVGLPVASANAVPDSEVLAVVVVEVQVVDCVAGSSVDDGRVVCIFPVVNQDSPDVNEDEEDHRGDLGQREQEGEDMVWQTLSITIKGVECVGGKRCGHNPLVVWLVDVLVDAWVVEAAVDPVDARVGEEQEEGKLGVGVPLSRALLCRVVKLRVAAHLGKEPGDGQDSHDGEGNVSLLHLKLDLVLEVARVVECGLVEDEEV